MKINDEGIKLIKYYEQLKLKAYLCPAAKLKPKEEQFYTIGYGTLIYPNGKAVKIDDTCTKEQAEQYLLHDISRFEAGIIKAVKKPLTSNQFSALVSFVYNVGLGAFNKSTLLKKVNINPNDASIKLEFLKYKIAAGKVLEGLLKRRMKESELYYKK